METSILIELKDMIRILEEILIDGEKFVSKGNCRAGLRVRKGMQQVRKKAKEVRDLVQDVKKTI